MTLETRKRKWRWLRHLAWVLGIKIVLVLVAVAIFFGSGAGNPLLRRLLVRRLEAATGATVELQTLSIQWLSLRATIKGLVIHGKEPAGTEPLFSAEEVDAGLRIDSFWGRKFSLNDLVILQPHVHLRFEKNGSSNIPVPSHTAGAPGKPLRETLFDLHVRSVHLVDGWVLYNDVKTPLAIEGGELKTAIDASGPLEHSLYLGTLDWQGVKFTATRDLPLSLNISAKFSFSREGFSVDQALVSARHSKFDVQAEMKDFTAPAWSFKYRAWVDLSDLRETLRNTPTYSGRVDVRGEGTFVSGNALVKGTFASPDVGLNYANFHHGGIVARGSYRLDNRGIDVPDLNIHAFDGVVSGKVNIRFDGLQFRAETHVQDVRLGEVLPAVEHRGFPIDELHWDGLITADTVETWTSAFHNFEINGKSEWSEPDDLLPGHVPVSAEWTFRYRHEPQILDVMNGEFDTPSTHLSVSGVFGRENTALDVHFETSALESFNDFFHAIEGATPSSPDAAKQIAGSANWDGRTSGPSGNPVFAGHFRGEQIRYDGVAFDSAEGDMSYSSSELTIARAQAHLGAMATTIDGTMALTNWSFQPDNEWSADLNFEKAPLEGFQQLAGKSYPVKGLLTGQFHGRGTRSAPALTGLFDLAQGNIYGVTFDRLRGQLNVQPDEARISNAELRVFPPGKENGRGAGIVTGTASYRFADQSISADLVGASLPLENFGALQSARFPVSGQATFRVKASGPAKAPQGEGTFRIVDLRVGQEVIGSFEGNATSDGSVAKIELNSAMTTGKVSGHWTIGLSDPYPIEGKASISNINLDPFLLTAMHLERFSGHGSAEGDITVNGTLKPPANLNVDANFSRLVLNYANMQLENAGPVHLRSTRDDLQIDPVTFRGTDTNLKIEGNLRYSGRRTLNLKLNGAMDLRLLTGFVPNLDTRGPAQINASVEGTMDRPRITGRVHIENASARAADFPTGLSAIKGDIVFDANRAFFENMTAEAGGGTMNLTGSVNYAEQPLRFDVSARTDKVRIRYPEGMSWQAGGSLRLTGTPDAAVLSGRVTVERVTMSEGVEAAGGFVSGKEAIYGPSTTSPFLRNLQFDIEGLSTPDARMEWPGAELEAEANVRVRGTWEHPILLGHIHILSGDLYFHGNRYRVARGDVNFANPFRLDPVLNVEATTTIQQYEITLNFNGPASKLALSYRSDPPLPGDDIITLLSFGQTGSESEVRSGGTSQSTTAGASAILSEAISSQLGGRLEKLFGITRFRVDPGLAGVGSTGSEQNAAARVTVEQQIARNLTITYVSNVSSTQQQIIQVEYNVNRNISVVALRDQNGTFGIDIKIKKRLP